MVGAENKERMEWLEAGKISWAQNIGGVLSLIKAFNFLLTAKNFNWRWHKGSCDLNRFDSSTENDLE